MIENDGGSFGGQKSQRSIKPKNIPYYLYIYVCILYIIGIEYT